MRDFCAEVDVQVVRNERRVDEPVFKLDRLPVPVMQEPAMEQLGPGGKTKIGSDTGPGLDRLVGKHLDSVGLATGLEVFPYVTDFEHRRLGLWAGYEGAHALNPVQHTSVGKLAQSAIDSHARDPELPHQLALARDSAGHGPVAIDDVAKNELLESQVVRDRRFHAPIITRLYKHANTLERAARQWLTEPKAAANSVSYRQVPGRRTTYMPVLHVLLRVVLVLLLLADGAVGVRAATSMLVDQAAVGGADASHVVDHGEPAPQSDCSKHGQSSGGHEDGHLCKCVVGAGCSCNCFLPLYSCATSAVLYVHRSSSPRLTVASLDPPREHMTPLFRPPIL